MCALIVRLYLMLMQRQRMSGFLWGELDWPFMRKAPRSCALFPAYWTLSSNLTVNKLVSCLLCIMTCRDRLQACVESFFWVSDWRDVDLSGFGGLAAASADVPVLPAVTPPAYSDREDPSLLFTKASPSSGKEVFHSKLGLSFERPGIFKFRRKTKNRSATAMS